MGFFWEILTFHPDVDYLSTCEKNWLREEDDLGDLLGVRGSKNLLETAIAMEAA
jgi:hypothetical protein